MKMRSVAILIFLAVMATSSDAWLQSVLKGIERDAHKLGDRLLGEAKQFGTRVVKTVITQARETTCRQVCPKICNDRIGRWMCPFVCKPVCPKSPMDTLARVKRSLVRGQHYSGHLAPLPNKFAAYDLNEDGVVSLEEMAVASGSDVTDPSFRKAFSLSDIDGNGVLSPKELYEGPFVFEKDVGETDYLYCKYTVNHKMTVDEAFVKQAISQIPRIKTKTRINAL